MCHMTQKIGELHISLLFCDLRHKIKGGYWSILLTILARFLVQLQEVNNLCFKRRYKE